MRYQATANGGPSGGGTLGAAVVGNVVGDVVVVVIVEAVVVVDVVMVVRLVLDLVVVVDVVLGFAIDMEAAVEEVVDGVLYMLGDVEKDEVCVLDLIGDVVVNADILGEEVLKLELVFVAEVFVVATVMGFVCFRPVVEGLFVVAVVVDDLVDAIEVVGEVGDKAAVVFAVVVGNIMFVLDGADENETELDMEDVVSTVTSGDNEEVNGVRVALVGKDAVEFVTRWIKNGCDDRDDD